MVILNEHIEVPTTVMSVHQGNLEMWLLVAKQNEHNLNTGAATCKIVTYLYTTGYAGLN